MYDSNSKVEKKLSFILLCAGSGSRMNSNIEKQFLKYGEKMLFEYSLEVAQKCEEVAEIIIASSEQNFSFFEDYCKKNAIDKFKCNSRGGATRQESVFNALECVSSRYDIVCIHDSARPNIRESYIKDCLGAIDFEHSGAIVGVFSRDSVKRLSKDMTIIANENREEIFLAHTPQIFKKYSLIKAHIKARNCNFEATDDASLMDIIGEKVKAIVGGSDNIKITFKEDLNRRKDDKIV